MTTTPEIMLSQDFGSFAELVRAQAARAPGKAALIDASGVIPYGDLSVLMDQVAAGLQRDGVGKGDVVAICAATSARYGAVFLGVLRAGAVVAPLAPSSTSDSLRSQIQDSGARVLFLDAATAERLRAPQANDVPRVALDDVPATGIPFRDWLAPQGAAVQTHDVAPDDAFNIIYSSGTTGKAKGIVQPHKMRWALLRSAGFAPESVALVSTPLYSNTTLVAFLAAVACGGSVVLLARFDAGQFLDMAQTHRVTHAMLVPVQYRRLLDHPGFDDYDLSAFRVKFSTSAPFSADLKAEVLRRWPGGLVEFYGMTEGGGTCALMCHAFPTKLHTVGQPLPGHDVRLIDEDGREVAPGQVGEVVGRSGAMMAGYNNNPGETSAAEWVSPEGLRFIRTGDVGRFDEDGFLILIDRKKDLIISGGFNIYPSDLEARLLEHPAVAEAAVIGVPSEAWGETPVGFAVLRSGQQITAKQLLDWANEGLGKTQRLSDLRLIDSLPRSAIGKVLKRDLSSAV